MVAIGLFRQKAKEQLRRRSEPAFFLTDEIEDFEGFEVVFNVDRFRLCIH